MKSLTSSKMAISITILGCLLIVLSAIHVLPREKSPVIGESESGYTSSQECQPCHPAIYKSWTHSMHAYAATNPAFLTALKDAIYNEGDEVREYCLSCHSPTIRVTKDFKLKEALSKEGVSCDFCHSISGVDWSQEQPFIIKRGIKKYGPLKNVSSPAHETVYSELHLRSEFCAGGCHQMISESGIPLIETYSEWRNSTYAQEGVHCQNCHMPYTDEPVVSPDVKETKNKVTVHNFLGAHSEMRLKQAAKLASEVMRKGEDIIVDVSVTNVGSGHKIPTGVPTRKVVLKVSLMDAEGKILKEQEKVYQKILVDKNGNHLLGTADSLLYAVGIFSDNRIAPKETRREQFKFWLPKSVTTFTVISSLVYKLEVAVPDTKLMSVKMAESIRKISPTSPATEISP